MRTERDREVPRAAAAGFTLIELLVVIAIIAILAGMLMPAIRGALVKAHESSTQNLIHQCEIAATGFFNDHGQYPPSTWLGFFKMYNLPDPDTNGDGVLSDAESAAVGFAVNPSTYNHGIEVFLACVASRDGGPYLQPSENQLANTDNDFDTAPVAPATLGVVGGASNWYFGGSTPQPLMEIVDWWGNPLVYINNRNYVAHDGTTAGWSYVACKTNGGAVVEGLSRDGTGFKTGTFPNLDSYQLYSLGADGAENQALSSLGDVTGAPDGSADGIPDYAVPYPWSLKTMHFLANWEE